MDRVSPIRVLLVEDNTDDVEIVRRALAESGIVHQLRVAFDGQEALDLLFDAGEPRPDVVLLDLNLPRVTGFEVLQHVRRSGSFPSIPIIIMTSSVNQDDVLKGYRLGANTYIQKRANLKRSIQVLGEYWSVFAKLPPVA